MIMNDQNDDRARSNDQPGISTAAPTPSPITKIMKMSAKIYSGINTNLAPTNTLREVGRAIL